MQEHFYSPTTNEYLYSDRAELDPLETEIQGKNVYMLAGGATFVEPLPFKEGYAVVWGGESWSYVEDHRQRGDEGGNPIEGTGTPYWLPEDVYGTPARYMVELGPLPEGAVRTPPAMTKDMLWSALRRERDTRINATDYLVLPDYPLAEEKKTDILVYRQALRDMTTLPGAPWDGGGPETPWPAMPEV